MLNPAGQNPKSPDYSLFFQYLPSLLPAFQFLPQQNLSQFTGHVFPVMLLSLYLLLLYLSLNNRPCKEKKGCYIYLP